MASYHTIAFKKRLRIDIIMKRSEIQGYKLQMEKVEKEMNDEDFCVGNFVALSNKKNELSDLIKKSEGELSQMETKLKSLIN